MAIVLIAIVCVAPIFSNAEETKKPKFLFGHDFELSTQHLANIVPHFDLRHLESRLRIRPEIWQMVMSDRVLNEYITYPGALEDLPAELREQLTKDLALSANLIDHQSTSITAPALIMDNRMPTPAPIKTRTLNTDFKISTDSTFLRPTPAPVPTKLALDTSRSGLLVPRGSDWQELARRWRALPTAEKLNVAKFNRLPNRIIADIIETKIPAAQKSTGDLQFYLRPKDDAPEWMRRVTYSLDGRNREVKPGARMSVEIALREPMESKDDFYRHLDEVAKTTGLKTELETPQLMKRSSAATHIHFSVDGPPEASMKKVMEAWKRLVLVRLLDAGEQYDPILEIPVGDRGDLLQNIYDRSIEAKHSLVRRVRGNHYELKEHAKNVKHELDEVLGLLDKPEAEAIEIMAKEVKATTSKNPSIVARIHKINPNVLRDFRDIVPEEVVNQALEMHLRKALASDKWPDVYGSVSRYSHKRELSGEAWPLFENLLRDPPGPHIIPAVNLIVGSWYLPANHPISQKYLSFFLANPNRINSEVMQTLRTMKILTPEAEREIAKKMVGLFESSDRGATKHAANVLRDLAFAYRYDAKLDDETRGVIIASVDEILKKRKNLTDFDIVELHATGLKLDQNHEVPVSDRPIFRRRMINHNSRFVDDAMFVVEHKMAEEMLFANPQEGTFQKYYRPEATDAAVKYSALHPADLIKKVTAFQGHGVSSLLSFVDLHAVPGFTDEVIKLMAIEDPEKLKRLIGSDGFFPLFKVRTIEAYRKLEAAIEASGRADLKELFQKVAPASLEKALVASGEWTDEAKSLVRKSAQTVPSAVPPKVVESVGSAKPLTPDQSPRAVSIDSSADASVHKPSSAGSTSASQVGTCQSLWSKIRKFIR